MSGVDELVVPCDGRARAEVATEAVPEGAMTDAEAREEAREDMLATRKV